MYGPFYDEVPVHNRRGVVCHACHGHLFVKGRIETKRCHVSCDCGRFYYINPGGLPWRGQILGCPPVPPIDILLFHKLRWLLLDRIRRMLTVFVILQDKGDRRQQDGNKGERQRS